MKAVRRYFDIVSDDDKTLFTRSQGDADGNCQLAVKEDCDCDVCMLRKREFDRAMKEDWHKAETFGPFTKNWWKYADKNKFEIVHQMTLTATSLVIIVRKSVSPFIRDIKGGVMPLGFMNYYGNKGAVNISFRIGKEKPLLFICNHLEAFTEKRNERYE